MAEHPFVDDWFFKKSLKERQLIEYKLKRKVPKYFPYLDGKNQSEMNNE